jgi:hypothetical protein
MAHGKWIWIIQKKIYNQMTASKPNPDRLKKESLERLINQYHQAVANSDTQQIKNLEKILKRLGHIRFKL